MTAPLRNDWLAASACVRARTSVPVRRSVILSSRSFTRPVPYVPVPRNVASVGVVWFIFLWVLPFTWLSLDPLRDGKSKKIAVSHPSSGDKLLRSINMSVPYPHPLESEQSAFLPFRVPSSYSLPLPLENSSMLLSKSEFANVCVLKHLLNRIVSNIAQISQLKKII